jgi:hypothetical protein
VRASKSFGRHVWSAPAEAGSCSGRGPLKRSLSRRDSSLAVCPTARTADGLAGELEDVDGARTTTDEP